LAEYGQLYRFERSGTLHGLFRVRGFCQNDAHIYVQEEEAVDEFVGVMKLHQYYYQKLNIKSFKVKLGLRDPQNLKKKYHGDEEMWLKAENMTRLGLEKAGIPYVEDIGGAVHYGPKGDIVIESVIGKEYAIGTCQIDLYMPQRFNLTYVDKDGKEKLEVVIHRAPLGSHERFIGILLDPYAGAFPRWLAPVQTTIIAVTDRHVDYANKVAQKLKEENIRIEVDDRNTTASAKIRNAELQKIPYILVVGDKEIKSKSVNVRVRGEKVLGPMSLNKFTILITQDIDKKRQV
ncbi:MAG: threonyl-tRNA synthetase, partial [Microgenomates group bacterium LiPW_31]